ARVHAGGGFVEQEELRPGGEPADDLEPALFAIRQAGGGCVAEPAKFENFQQLVHAPGDGVLVVPERALPEKRVPRAGLAVKVAGHPDIVEDREGSEQPDVLEGARDAALDNLVDPEAGQVLPAEVHPAM